MAKSIFLSWSGESGDVIATALKAAIENALRPISVELMSPRDRHGAEWREILDDTLNKADIGIFVLTPEWRKSWLLPLEMGMLRAKPIALNSETLAHHALIRDTKLYVMTFNIHDQEHLSKIARNCWPFSRESFVDLLKALKDNHASDELKLRHQPEDRNFDKEIWLPLLAKIQSLSPRLEVIEQRERWIAKIRDGLLGEFDPGVEVGIGDAVSNLMLAGKSDIGIFESLISLLHALERKHPESSQERWTALETEMSEDTITRAAHTVSDINSGIIELPIVDAAEYYVREIMMRVQKSMWTVNVGAYQGSFGRGADKSVLRAHEAIKRRNPSAILQRVFVIDTDPNNTKALATVPEEASKLGDIMREQEDHAIETWAISRAAFRKIIQKNYIAVRRIGSHDFNILDDCRVYVTSLHVGQNGIPLDSEVEFIRLLRDKVVVEKAQSLKRIIMKDSMSIQNGDLSGFFEKANA